MGESFNSSVKRNEDVDFRTSSNDLERVQQITKLNQELSKDHYRALYMELARKLAAANTGEVILVQDDCAFWLQGYEKEFTFDEEEGEFEPYYEPYGYNSQEYADCVTEAQKALTLHRANLLRQSILNERTTLASEAAEMGYPSDLHFVRRSNAIGLSCRTWIIGASGTPRDSDYHVGDPKGKEFYEGWSQLLPHEVVAVWRKDYISGPHYFGLELYLDAAAIPACLDSLATRIPSTNLALLTVDSDMSSLNSRQQKILQEFLSIAQLECLGTLQISIEQAYCNIIDSIHGQPSPDIAGGWLRLLGIEQAVTPEMFYEVADEDDYVDEEDFEDDAEE